MLRVIVYQVFFSELTRMKPGTAEWVEWILPWGYEGITRQILFIPFLSFLKHSCSMKNKIPSWPFWTTSVESFCLPEQVLIKSFGKNKAGQNVQLLEAETQTSLLLLGSTLLGFLKYHSCVFASARIRGGMGLNSNLKAQAQSWKSIK